MTTSQDMNDLAAFDASLNDLFGGGERKNQIAEGRFRQFCVLTQQIGLLRDQAKMLDRLMDAAIEMTGAERGFVLMKGGSKKAGPIPGFEAVTARQLNRASLKEENFRLSLTAVEEALKKGDWILTDDAQLDPRFRDRQSVAQLQLKSILVVPLQSEGEILGAIYLDHRLERSRFQPDDVLLLCAFAAHAAMMLKNLRLIAELTEARNALQKKVEVQARRIETLVAGKSGKARDLRYAYAEIVGRSEKMLKALQQLDHVSETTVPVWIFGESGTGKELVARALHENSPRNKGAFIAENVSAISETLLESELFGHKKGAFTHADRDRIGLFEQANGGTLFLDEIADMSLAMQSKLLRVLQEGEIRPVGSSKVVKVDVRLVSASNRDLRQMIKEGKFRKDLFYRVAGLTVALPPLRERREDIPLLAEHLIGKIAKSMKVSSGELSPDGLDLLLHYAWPGNVRELEAVLRNALLFSRGQPLTANLLRPQLENSPEVTSPSIIPPLPANQPPSQSEDEAEKSILIEALKKNRMNKKETAAELGITPRTLYTRMALYGIPKKKTVLRQYLGVAG